MNSTDYISIKQAIKEGNWNSATLKPEFDVIEERLKKNDTEAMKDLETLNAALLLELPTASYHWALATINSICRYYMQIDDGNLFEFCIEVLKEIKNCIENFDASEKLPVFYNKHTRDAYDACLPLAKKVILTHSQNQGATNDELAEILFGDSLAGIRIVEYAMNAFRYNYIQTFVE